MDKRLPQELPAGRNAGALWLGALAGATIAMVVIALWWIINERAHEHIEAAIENAAHINRLLIQHDVDNRIASLDRLAQRWIETGGTSRPAWEADASRYTSDMPGFQAIQWVDASSHIRWVVPLDGNEAMLDLDVSTAESSRLALLEARESGKVVLSQPFKLVHGRLAIAVYVPVSRSKQFDGAIVGVLDLGSWLAAIIGDLQGADYHARVLVQDEEAYRYDPDSSLPDESRTSSSTLVTHGLTWTVLVTPTSHVLSAGHADSSLLVLIAGLLLSAVIGLVVYLALVARVRSRQLHEKAGQLKTLFQNLPGMAYRCKGLPNRPMEFVSDGCKDLSGYSRSDFEDQRVSWGNLIHPNDRESVSQKLKQAVDNTAAFEIEYRVVTRADQKRWMWERGRVVSLDGRKDILVEGFISDITDRKRAEIALVEARAFSEAVVDIAVDAVITIGANGKIETFNRAAQHMFGYTIAEAKGKEVNMLLHGSQEPNNIRNIGAYFANDEVQVTGPGRETSGQRKDGSVFPIHFSVSEVLSRQERKFVGLIRDISAQRAAEAEARQHREQLAHMDRLDMLGEMASGIAHEINQPLTAISLFAQAAKRLFSAGKLDQLPAVFEKLSQHAIRAGAVIERMQTMARRQESAKEVADCNVLVEEVAKLAEAEARIRDMTIEVDTAGDLPAVDVDTVQIQQVALNLLRNAMEAMRSVDCRDGNVVRLQTRLRDDCGVEVAVIDKGCGVSDTVAEILFTPFSTTKESGLGMGLSISRAIITAHGGHLDFYNNDFGGATFFFTLPAATKGD